MGIKSSVSLYSLQYQYLRGNMDLEQIVDYVMGLGADGIELLPDQMLKGTPTPSEETYAAWDKIIEKHHPGLACDDIFLNTNLYSNRTLTKRECRSDQKRNRYGASPRIQGYPPRFHGSCMDP